MFKTILFDLDGTLLPMNQDEFVAAYFAAIARKFVPRGYNKDELIKAVWSGTKLMVTNDGTSTNREVFWREFAALMGDDRRADEPEFDLFYKNEFDAVRRVIKDTGFSRKLVDELKAKNYNLILATRPVFPAVAVETRLGWAGLRPGDFTYITTYENSTYCKPSLGYYAEILRNTGARAESCIMVGNSVDEDMAARALGIKVFLVTDYLENATGGDITGYARGSLENFAEYIAFNEDYEEE